MGQIQSIEEFINFLLRRRWLIIILTVIGMAVSLIYAKTRPDTYESGAVIQVQGAQVAETATGAGGMQNDGGGAAQVLQTIEQRLTTREALAAMIERHNLFPELAGEPIDKRIFALRTSVTFQGVDSAAGPAFGASRSISAIIIYARYGTPEGAARIANDFAQGILDQSSSNQRGRADQTLAFFREEEARIAGEITAKEAEVATYKNAHPTSSPAIVGALQDESAGLSTDIRTAEQGLAALQVEQASIQQLRSLRETDKRRLAEIVVQVEQFTAQIAASRARLTQVDTALADSPEVERVLSGYARLLQQLQDQYQVITQRMAEAETSQRLAERQQSQRFSLLERAVEPEYPVGGGKKKLAIAGTIASLIAGIVAAFLLDMWKPVVRTSAQMQRQLDLEPVVCIPEFRAPKGRIGTAALKLIDKAAPKGNGMPRWMVLTTIAGAGLIVLVAIVAAIS